MVLPVTAIEYDEELENDSNGRVIYQGWARPVTVTGGTALPIWNIQKFIYDSNGILIKRRNADGNAQENKIWDDRSSYTYYV